MTCLLRALEPEQITDDRGYAYRYSLRTWCGNGAPIGVPVGGYPNPVTTDLTQCTCDTCFNGYMGNQVYQAEVLNQKKRDWLQKLADQNMRNAAEHALNYLIPPLEKPKSD